MRPPQRSIHPDRRCLDPALPANRKDRGRLVEVGPHRLLDENVGADWNALKHRSMRGGRRREIEDRALRRERLIERAEDPNTVGLGDAFRPRRVEIVDACNGKAHLGVCGEMRVGDDRARAVSAPPTALRSQCR